MSLFLEYIMCMYEPEIFWIHWIEFNTVPGAQMSYLSRSEEIESFTRLENVFNYLRFRNWTWELKKSQSPLSNLYVILGRADVAKMARNASSARICEFFRI